MLGDDAAGQPYVFISYASADRETVRTIVDELRSVGITCWLDERDIGPGANWGGSIADAIEGCAALVLLASAASLASRNVRQEVALAWQHEKPCLPLLLDTTPAPNDIAYWLATAQWIEVLDHPPSVWLPRVTQALDRLGFQSPAGQRPEQAALDAGPPHTSPMVVPVPLTPTVGRATEIIKISDRLRTARLLTLLGPGGTGKTRLAQEVARSAQDAFPDGAVWVDLAPITDAALVIPAIAATFGVKDMGGQPLIQTLAGAIGARRFLLVIDNVEQVVDAAKEISELLRRCPNLTVLATSRVALRVTAEQEYLVPPLAVPEVDADLERLRGSSAVALFVQRAQAVRPAFALTAENAESVATICRRLDGLPLALELAAARVQVLATHALLERLDRPLEVLRGGARDLPERQRTIRATIQWSYDLLTAEEQRLLRRLAIFVGGWTPEAAEAVVNASDDGEIDVLEGLISLTDNTLVVRREQPDGELRFGMLETIREFAREQLDQHDDVAALQRAHARYFLSRLEALDVERRVVSTFAESEFPNVRAAIRWGLAHDNDLAARLIGALRVVWLFRGQLRESLALASAALSGLPQPTAARVRLLNVVTNAEMGLGNLALASAAAEEAVGIARALGDDRLLAEMLQESADIFVHRRDATPARSRYDEALAISRGRGDDATVASSLMGLGAVAFLDGDVDETISHCEAALALARQGREPVVWGFIPSMLADALVVRGERTRALALYREVITQPTRFADLRYVIRCIEGVARIVSTTDLGRASILLGATRMERDRIAYETVSVVVAVACDRDALIDDLRRALGADAFAAAWERGRRMSLQDAIALALELTDA